jgi:Protein of unknown function (DUF1570)
MPIHETTAMFRLSAVLLLTATLANAQPTNTWNFDRLELKSGHVFDGVVLDENVYRTSFRIVSRPAGRPTVTLTTWFTPAEIKKLTKLSDDERKLLKDRLTELDNQGAGDTERLTAMELKPTTWQSSETKALRYESDQFELVSGAPEEITRRAALRLEQMNAAFTRVLPPRYAAAKPIRVELAGTNEQYKAAIQSLGTSVLNSAVYVPTENRIICGSELARLGEELAKTRKHHEGQLAAIAKTEKELRELYKGQRIELERYLAATKKERDKVIVAERENTAAFDRATRQMFGALYHEAFHAYANSFVYPSRTPEQIRDGKGHGELPRWLNEGLAQLFEDPIIEAGELRIGHADTLRLKQVQSYLKSPTAEMIGLVPLGDLLVSGKEQFVTAHINQKEITDRSYLSAWALAYYLTFEKRLIGTKVLDEYITAVNTGTEAKKAFAELVGTDLITFEKDWHEYLKRLQTDGTIRKDLK